MKASYFILAFSLWVSLVSFTTVRNEPQFDRTSVSVKDSDVFYEFSATYDPAKTGKVQSYLDDHLRQRGDASFKNAELDATMTLNDKTVFYIKSSPGKLLIKFDKRRNSSKAYARFKKLGDDLRAFLTDK
ncbi:hypothetical protein GCM10028803_10280 [Larkinella knui]|uniref:Uncharacterized protein n=1 Tax=Larkinella knui TaxID=2025310 RepID=A0A3P1CCD4_9BACT|nr:hypothetical protein [Larkinella knui]RRB10999.1 hypothetical protein EHT87_28070 [Larkinella knui]